MQVGTCSRPAGHIIGVVSRICRDDPEESPAAGKRPPGPLAGTQHKRRCSKIGDRDGSALRRHRGPIESLGIWPSMKGSLNGPSRHCGETAIRIYGGETGIRTQVRVSPKHAFQACAFSHSAISPSVSLNLAYWAARQPAPQAPARARRSASPAQRFVPIRHQ
jgi:hypothetical protein